MKPLFGEALVDEVALKNDARQILLTAQGQLSPEYLRLLTKEQGVNLATMVLYIWLKEFKHKAFCNTLSAVAAEPDNKPTDARLLIVPGMFYQEYPELGGDGKLIEQIANRCGIETCIIPIASTGSILENANTISQYIKQYVDHDIWLVSVSKGSAELGLCLNSLDEKYRENVQGWISLCGIFKGSPVADIRLTNPLSRVILKAYMKWIGADYRGIDDMRTTHAWWNSCLEYGNVELIHVQPIPLAGYVHPDLVNRYRQLSVSGPNDGTIYLDDLVTRVGHVYPIWGVDHFLRDREVAPLIYKLCHYIKKHRTKRNCENEITQKQQCHTNANTGFKFCSV